MSHNTWTHRMVRPLIRPLATSIVTPNHITTLRFATALAAFGLLAFGQGEWNDWAAASFLLSFFLDRADGELARQSGKSSPLGHRYDLVTDALSNILIFLGIGIGLRDSQLGYGAIVLGLLAGGGIVAMLWLMSKVESQAGIGAAAFSATAGFDPDDAMAIVPFAIWLNGEMPILIAAAIGAPAFFLWACWKFRRYLSPTGAPR
jgi:archaetidylinositol phosphate synthase